MRNDDYLLEEGVDAAEEILATVYSVDIAKALNPLKKKDFLVIVARLARVMKKVNLEHEAPAMRKALDDLDVDWATLSTRQVDRVIKAASASLAVIPKAVLPVFDKTFEVAAGRVARGTRSASRKKFRLKIPVKLSEQDERIVKWASESHTNFVRDEYGRRRVGFSRQARKIAGEGLAQGLSSKDIARNMQEKLTSRTFNRNEHYWTSAASAFVNRSRVFGQMSTFEEAGVEKFQFDAVLDQRTTDICRFMHGKIFTVSSGLQQFRDVENLRDPEKVKDVQPWVWNSSDANGNKVMVFETGGVRQEVARIKESAVGTIDRTGTFSHKMSDAELQSNGLTAPPLHGRCRSTILPVL